MYLSYWQLEKEKVLSFKRMWWQVENCQTTQRFLFLQHHSVIDFRNNDVYLLTRTYGNLVPARVFYCRVGLLQLLLNFGLPVKINLFIWLPWFPWWKWKIYTHVYRDQSRLTFSLAPSGLASNSLASTFSRSCMWPKREPAHRLLSLHHPRNGTLVKGTPLKIWVTADRNIIPRFHFSFLSHCHWNISHASV